MEKKGIALPIKVIIIGCLVGLVIIGIGGFKQIDAKKINKQREENALKASEDAVAIANKRLEEIQEEYYPLKEQYEIKLQECDAMDMSEQSWFENHSKCKREANDIQSKISALEMENTTIRNKDYYGYYETVKPMSYQIFYIIGASIIGLALLGAFIIYLVKGKKGY